MALSGSCYLLLAFFMSYFFISYFFMSYFLYVLFSFRRYVLHSSCPIYSFCRYVLHSLYHPFFTSYSFVELVLEICRRSRWHVLIWPPALSKTTSLVLLIKYEIEKRVKPTYPGHYFFLPAFFKWMHSLSSAFMSLYTLARGHATHLAVPIST